MKRFFIILIVLCLLLAGCGKSPSSPPEESGTSELAESTPDESSEPELSSEPTTAPESESSEAISTQPPASTESKTSKPTTSSKPETEKPKDTTSAPTQSSSPIPNEANFASTTVSTDSYTLTVKSGAVGVYAEMVDKLIRETPIMPFRVSVTSKTGEDFYFAVFGASYYEGWYTGAVRKTDLASASTVTLPRSGFIPSESLSSATINIYVAKMEDGVLKLGNADKYVFVWNGSKLVAP